MKIIQNQNVLSTSSKKKNESIILERVLVFGISLCFLLKIF